MIQLCHHQRRRQRWELFFFVKNWRHLTVFQNLSKGVDEKCAGNESIMMGTAINWGGVPVHAPHILLFQLLFQRWIHFIYIYFFFAPSFFTA
jgi:hypothetical protein